MAAQWQEFSQTAERVGLALVATAGLASALSTFVLLSYIVWNTFLVREKSTPLPRGICSFTRSSLGCYLLSLILCDFLQGAAFTLNYRWSAVGYMAEGKVCTIQGSVSEVGDLGAAIWSIAIAFHTFWLLFLVRKPHRLTAPIILVGGWSLLLFLPVIGPFVIQTPRRGTFYGLSGAWCWIGKGYGAERLIYLYGWIFAALGSSVVIYTLIYLRFSNIIAHDEHGKLKFHFRRPKTHTSSGTSASAGLRMSRRLSSSLPWCFDWVKDTLDQSDLSSGTGTGSDHISNGSQPPVGKHLKRIARRLMWYPILYALVVLPVSICRMGVLAGWDPPFGLLVFAGICFGSSGVSNVILFITTRHSFIKQVAKTQATRVHITTQRITVREDSTTDGQDVELDDMKLADGAMPSPRTDKSARYLTTDPPKCLCSAKDRVTIMNHDATEGEDMERKAGIRITVLGKR